MKPLQRSGFMNFDISNALSKFGIEFKASLLTQLCNEAKFEGISIDTAKSCVMIQGFADHGELGLKAVLLSGIFKNIQPISVGV